MAVPSKKPKAYPVPGPGGVKMNVIMPRPGEEDSAKVAPKSKKKFNEDKEFVKRMKGAK